jgi:hypothetical protein
MGLPKFSSDGDLLRLLPPVAGILISGNQAVLIDQPVIQVVVPAGQQTHSYQQGSNGNAHSKSSS